MSPFTYAIPWVKELKEKHYRVLYLSNFSRKIRKECADALEFMKYMDGGIMSYEVHTIKPEPKIYQLLIERYHLIPEDCVFIDDRPVNLAGAESFGIQTILFENVTQAKKALQRILD